MFARRNINRPKHTSLPIGPGCLPIKIHSHVDTCETQTWTLPLLTPPPTITRAFSSPRRVAAQKPSKTMKQWWIWFAAAVESIVKQLGSSGRGKSLIKQLDLLSLFGGPRKLVGFLGPWPSMALLGTVRWRFSRPEGRSVRAVRSAGTTRRIVTVASGTAVGRGGVAHARSYPGRARSKDVELQGTLRPLKRSLNFGNWKPNDVLFANSVTLHNKQC